MKITQKHIQYILLLLIVAIAVGAYYLGYVGFIEKANAVKQTNKGIEARIDELSEKESHRTQWTDGIEKSYADTEEVLAKYGAGNTPEKSILFVKSLEKAADMTISSISFSPTNLVFTSDSYDENGEPRISMSSTSLAINYATSYEGLKKCMDYINNYPERMNVSSFSATSSQETGQVIGNMLINLFSVHDDKHEYKEPSISGIDLGVDCIFGTMNSGVEDSIVSFTEGDTESTENGENGESSNEPAGD